MDENFLVGAEKFQEMLVAHGVTKCQVREGPPSGFDGACGCGEEIPEARVALGYYRCLNCQTLLERDKKMRGR